MINYFIFNATNRTADVMDAFADPRMTEKEARAYLRDHIVFVPCLLKKCRDDNGYSESACGWVG